MIDTQALQRKILDAAISGKLTQQLPEDGNAEDLYKQIQSEKKKLIREGKLKKDKPFPEVDDKDVPFKIPENWKWVRLSEIGQTQTGNTPSCSNRKYYGSSIPFIGPGEISVSHGICEASKWLSELGKTVARVVPSGSILQVCIGSSIGKSAITQNEIAFNQQINAVSPIICDSFYVHTVVRSDYFVTYILNHATGNATPIFNRGSWDNMYFPLPPLAEQKRIVSKIDAIFSQLDQIDKEQKKLADNSIALRNRLLEHGIRGKLTEQLASDGDAEMLYADIQKEKQRLIKEGKIKKEKPLPEIAENDIPFYIPVNWKWVRLGDITSYAQPKMKISPESIKPETWSLDLEDIEKDSGNITSVVKASDRKIVGDKIVFNRGQLLYSKLRPYLRKILIAPDCGVCTPEIIPFDCYGIKDAHYLLQVLRSPYVDATVNAVSYGVKMPRVGTDTMTNLLIPLPPLAEQKRIVEKLDQLLPLCGALKADISGDEAV